VRVEWVCVCVAGVVSLGELAGAEADGSCSDVTRAERWEEQAGARKDCHWLVGSCR
jgi:hypothetical protein